MLRRLLIVTLLASLILWAALRMSAQRLPTLETALTPLPVGAYHVHSAASHDCEQSLDEIASAAARLGLSFVVVTDHNKQQAGPVRIDDVLLVSHAEVSTPFGHVVNLGGGRVPEKAERRGLDVHAKLRALGGIPIPAHPTDRKRPWTGPIAGAGGIEIANLSAAARRRGGPIFVGLLPSLFAYRLNPSVALAQVYDRDERALHRWDQESDPGFIGLCGTDAHGRYLDYGLNMVAWLIGLGEQLPEGLKEQPTALIELLAAGRFHCVAGLLGRDVLFDFVAKRGDDVIARTGEFAYVDAVDELVVTAPRSTRERPTLVLLRNGEEVVRTQGTSLRYADPGPGTYRVEVRVGIPGVLFGARMVPVIYSNRIRVKAPGEVASSASGG